MPTAIKPGTFGTPPAQETVSHDRLPHDDYAKEMKRHKGEWMYIGKANKSLRNQILRGIIIAYRPAGSFEVRLGEREYDPEYSTPRYKFWVRYVG